MIDQLHQLFNGFAWAQNTQFVDIFLFFVIKILRKLKECHNRLIRCFKWESE